MEYCDGLELASSYDWRLPDNRELQNIVEYGKTDVPAAFFECSFNESYCGAEFEGDHGWYWSSRTLGDFPENGSYFAFGRENSITNLDSGTIAYSDWKGAGAQRSDRKMAS